MLKLPVVLRKSALAPLAVFKLPVVLPESALPPLAVLKLPVALLKSAPPPMAVLDELMVTPGSDITGVAPPEETNGAVAVTAVTTDPGTSLETPMEPSWISAPVSDPSKTLAPVTALSARLTVVTQPIHFFSECPPGGSSFGGSPFGGAF